MLEGLAARFIIKQKQILTHIHIICLFFLSFFFSRCWETEVRICCHLDCVDVMCQIWFYLSTKFYLKLMKFSAFYKYSYAFLNVGLMKMKEVFTT